MAHLAFDRAAGLRLVILEFAAKFGDLAFAQGSDNLFFIIRRQQKPD
jgi:hypothetical protein